MDRSNRISVLALVSAAIAFVSMVITGVNAYTNWNAAKVSNRAYLILDHFVSSDSIYKDQYFRPSGVYVNVGNTPAYDVSIRWYLNFSSSTKFLDTIDLTKPTTKREVGSNLELPVGGGDSIQVTEERYARLMSWPPHAYFYTYAKVWYTDVFDERHSTEFLARLNVATMKWESVDF